MSVYNDIFLCIITETIMQGNIEDRSQEIKQKNMKNENDSN